MKETFEIQKFAKFPLLPNSKLPACKWNDSKTHIYDQPLPQNQNYGILTGKVNNLLVLDIDIKDHGLEEWQAYVQRNGDIKTVIISSPSGGFHYYFLYHSSNEANEQLLRDYLHTQTKLRNVGLDIRSDGGYVVGPNSSINNKAYSYVQNSQKNPVQEMPTELILWLLEGKSNKEEAKQETVNTSSKANPINHPKSDLVFMINDQELTKLLQMVPQEYCDNYLKWLSITNVLKGMNKQEIWDTWSQKSKNYHHFKDLTIWNRLNSFLDVNYIIHIINGHNSKRKLELIESYKPYKPFTTIKYDSFILKEFVMNYLMVRLRNCLFTYVYSRNIYRNFYVMTRANISRKRSKNHCFI